MIKYYELTESELKTATKLDPGSFICCSDTKRLFFVPDGMTTAIKMGSEIELITEVDRANMLTPVSGKFYFTTDTGKLWCYMNSWFMVNPDIHTDFDIDNVILTKGKSITVLDDRIVATSVGTFVPDLSVNDLVTNIKVTTALGLATISGTNSYDIPGTLKIHNI